MAMPTRKGRRPTKPRTPVTWDDLEPWMGRVFNDPILQHMKAKGYAPTRETYIELNWMEPRTTLGAEEECELPEPFQHGWERE